MKNILPILLILALSACKKEDFNPNLTRKFSILSTNTGANYTMKVALPEDYHPETKKYDVIYLLDGEQNFDYVADNCKKTSSTLSTSNVIVVSIGYGLDRSVDYTPPKVNGNGGGGDKFMLFIKHELIPKMENDFAADTSRKSRSIMGHSFGGLLASYAFTNYNSVFGNYFLLSPSLWYDNEIMLKMEQEHRNINKNNPQFVYMGIGELENIGQMFAPYEAFHQRLQNNYPDMVLKSHRVPKMNHMGSRNPNIIEGLKFYFQNR